MRITAVLKRHRRGGLCGSSALASAATLTAIASALAAGSPAQAATGLRPGAITPGTISQDTTLNGVSAVSATVAWVAGYYEDSSGAWEPVLLHCEGTGCKRVPVSAPSGAENTTLTGVSAGSAASAWVAGYYQDSSGVWEPLVLRCTGSGCTPVSSSAPSGAESTTVQGVSAVSATSAWVAGYYQDSSGVQEPLILRCEATCKPVKSPAPSGALDTHLNGVTVGPAGGAWAAGTYENSKRAWKTLILQKTGTGTAWKRVASPTPSIEKGNIPWLWGVSADSAGDAWAAGYYQDNSGVQQPLILQWSGTAWSQPAVSALSGAQGTYLQGVSAVSAASAWAAGYYTNGSQEPLILQWNGTTWSQAAVSAPRGALDTTLAGVSADSAADAWAAGDYTNGSGVTESLVVHCNGTGCKKVASPNGP